MKPETRITRIFELKGKKGTVEKDGPYVYVTDARGQEHRIDYRSFTRGQDMLHLIPTYG